MNKLEMYKILEETKEKKQYFLMCVTMYLVSNYPLIKRDLFFACLYLLIQNGYVEEAEEILGKVKLIKKDEQTILQVVRNAIRNKTSYGNMSMQKKEDYEYALHYGKMYLQNMDFTNAYVWFEKGFDRTKQPVFLYYLGKTLYKMKKYKRAKPYFLQYVQMGDEKLSKTYLYLREIEYYAKNFKKMFIYADELRIVNKLYEEDFTIIERYNGKDLENEDIDIRKLREQNQFYWKNKKQK